MVDRSRIYIQDRNVFFFLCPIRLSGVAVPTTFQIYKIPMTIQCLTVIYFSPDSVKSRRHHTLMFSDCFLTLHWEGVPAVAMCLGTIMGFLWGWKLQHLYTFIIDVPKPTTHFHIVVFVCCLVLNLV